MEWWILHVVRAGLVDDDSFSIQLVSLNRAQWTVNSCLKSANVYTCVNLRLFNCIVDEIFHASFVGPETNSRCVHFDYWLISNQRDRGHDLCEIPFDIQLKDDKVLNECW